jgi:archaellum component FlaC
MYQKVEGIANLDLGAIQSAMTSTSADVLRVEEVAKEIKVELKEDLARLRTAQYNLENRIDSKLQSIDVRITTMDNKLDKFDIQLDDTEEKLMKRIQQSLDNPLSN